MSDREWLARWIAGCAFACGVSLVVVDAFDWPDWSALVVVVLVTPLATLATLNAPPRDRR